MKILIVGAGEAGVYLARVLSDEGHEIVIIDHDQSRLATVEESLDVKAVLGHGAAAGVLERAGAWGADMALAVTNDDEVNMLAAFFCKVQGAKRTIVRLKGGENLQYHRNFYKKWLGFDSILVPNELCSQEILELVRAKQAVAVENFADGRIQMRQIQVTPSSKWINQKLARVKMPEQTLVTAVIRGGEITIPSGDTEIAAGDELLIVGHTHAMDGFEKLGGRSGNGETLVVIIGGGELGLSVARSLEYTNTQVRLIEEDRERAEAISDELDEVTVLHGDGTDAVLLREVGADNADVFISACGADEMNLMSCQLAKDMGAKKTIALVKKADYVAIYQKLGIDAAISPRLLLAQKILRYVRSGAISTIAVIGEGKAEVIEIEAMPESKVTGAPISRIGFPRGAIIGAVAREEKVFIPDGSFQIQPGDSCIVFTFNENLPLVEKFFRGRKKLVFWDGKGGGP
jgi:trk system potassium uptake protein TrkA